LVSETGLLCYHFSASMHLSLVYHAGALGDFITTLPAMSAWRRRHPRDWILLLGVPELAAVAPQGLFDEIWDARSPRFAALFADGIDPASPLGRRLSELRSALLFSHVSSRLSTSLLRLGPTEIIRQDPFPSQRTHIVDYHLSLFSGNAFSEEDRQPRIASVQGTIPVPRDTVALHPGSGGPGKNWPFSGFTVLAGLLSRAGYTVRWIIGPAEEDLALPFAAEAWRNTPLADLAAALRDCRLFVGNDSGVSHLAAAAGCATVALFGATDPGVWAPRGPRVRVLQAPGATMSALSAETVFSECLGFLRG